MKLVLASSSPRRKQILRKLGLEFESAPSAVVEKMRKGSAKENAKRLALEKAQSIAAKKRWEGRVVIGADTIVERKGKFYFKTSSKKRAREALRELSGKWHNVWSAVAIVKGKRKLVFCDRAKVRMKRLGEKAISAYAASGEALGKAGCYNVAGKGSKLVGRVVGERDAVAGLPSKRLGRAIRRFVAL